jgi:hypothetical protein
MKTYEQGDCYEANFNRFTKNDNKDEVLVHTLREFLGKGTELWGGHAFILNTKTDQVYDYSNGAIRRHGKPLIIAKGLIYDKWGITEKLITGKDTYFEYTQIEACKLAVETKHYGSWELKYENWEETGWGDYMKDYFVPNFMPIRFEMESK